MRSYPNEGDDSMPWHLQSPWPVDGWLNADVGPAGAGAGHHHGATTASADPKTIATISPIGYPQSASPTSTHTVNSPMEPTSWQTQQPQFDNVNLGPVSSLTSLDQQYAYPTGPLDHPSRAPSPYGAQYMAPAPTSIPISSTTFVPKTALNSLDWPVHARVPSGIIGPNPSLHFLGVDLVCSPSNLIPANAPAWSEQLPYREPGFTPIPTPKLDYVASDGAILGDTGNEDQTEYKPAGSRRSKRKALNGSKKRDDPVYPASPQVGSWGPLRNGKPLFQYNEHAELKFEKTYTANEIRYYIDNCPRRLTLWVQQSPTQIAPRLGPFRNKCMWEGCMIKGHKIGAGWLRVAFDEFEELMIAGLKNPIQVAGCMHLFCFERCFDPVVDYYNDKLKAETRDFPREYRAIFSINKGPDSGIVSECFHPWFDEKTPLPYPRQYKFSLSYDLNKHHLDIQTAARQKAREKHRAKGINARAKTIDAHQGDVDYYLDVNAKMKKNESIISKVMKNPENRFQVRGLLSPGVSIKAPCVPLDSEIALQMSAQETQNDPLLSPSVFLLEEDYIAVKTDEDDEAEPSEDEDRPSKKRKTVAEDVLSAHLAPDADWDFNDNDSLFSGPVSMPNSPAALKKLEDASKKPLKNRDELAKSNVPSGKVSPTCLDEAGKSWTEELDPSLFIF